MADSRKYVYSFGGGKAEGKADMKELLGGKGANLAEMSTIGIPVPPGFTITTEVCAEYYDLGRKLPEAVRPQVEEAVKQMEQAVGMSEARRPDAARIGIATHVELTGSIERPCHQTPVDEVARLVNLHAREPLERGCRNVVVVADAHDRRIGIKPPKNWICDDGC